jgi:hypothetical protein
LVATSCERSILFYKIPAFAAALDFGSEHHLVTGHEWYVHPFLSQPKPPMIDAQVLTCAAVPEIAHTNCLDDSSRLDRAAKAIDHSFKPMHFTVH